MNSKKATIFWAWSVFLLIIFSIEMGCNRRGSTSSTTSKNITTTDTKSKSPSVEELINKLREYPNTDKAIETIGKLKQIDPTGNISTPYLIKGLDADDSHVRFYFAFVLAQIKKANMAINELIRALQYCPGEPCLAPADGDYACNGAVLALGGLREAIPLLMEKLESKDVCVRMNAATALGVGKSEARDAIPNLKKLLTDKSHLVRFEAAYALLKITPDLVKDDDVIPIFVKTLNGENDMAAHRALMALKKHGTKKSLKVIREYIGPKKGNFSSIEYKLTNDSEDWEWGECSGEISNPTLLYEVGITSDILAKGVKCIAGDFDGNGYLDFSLYSQSADEYLVLMFEKDKLIYSEKISLSRGAMLKVGENNYYQGLVLYRHRRIGIYPSKTDGLVRWGQGDATTLYMFDREIKRFKKIMLDGDMGH